MSEASDRSGGRPVTASGAKAAAHREAARRWYRKLSAKGKVDYVRRRDQDAQREADNRRYAKDTGKRDAARTKREVTTAPAVKRARIVAQAQAIGKSCEKCGSRSNLERHHHKGYSNPAKTITLCSKCHSRMEASYKGVRKS